MPSVNDNGAIPSGLAFAFFPLGSVMPPPCPFVRSAGHRFFSSRSARLSCSIFSIVVLLLGHTLSSQKTRCCPLTTPVFISLFAGRTGNKCTAGRAAKALARRPECRRSGDFCLSPGEESIARSGYFDLPRRWIRRAGDSSRGA